LREHWVIGNPFGEVSSGRVKLKALVLQLHKSPRVGSEEAELPLWVNCFTVAVRDDLRFSVVFEVRDEGMLEKVDEIDFHMVLTVWSSTETLLLDW